MVDLVNLLTLTERLLDSNIIGVFVMSYVFLFLIIFVSFVNIYSIDKYEFLNNTQKCIDFKRRMLFIIMYSKTKNIVSKKTLISELIGYGIIIGSIISMGISFLLITKTAFLILLIWFIIACVYGAILGYLARKIKKMIKGITS